MLIGDEAQYHHELSSVYARLKLQKNEIERLNAQVAMLVDALKTIRDERDCITMSDIADVVLIKCSPSDWLANHDAKVRDNTVDEVADKVSDEGMRELAKIIRAMKGE